MIAGIFFICLQQIFYGVEQRFLSSFVKLIVMQVTLQPMVELVRVVPYYHLVHHVNQYVTQIIPHLVLRIVLMEF